MTTPKADHAAAKEEAEWYAPHKNLARCYLDLAERHKKLVEVAKLYEEEGMALRADIRKQWRDDLRAALAAEEKEGR